MLSRSQAREFYDRLGSRQDSQSWYEDAALDQLCLLGRFESAQSVVEFGCGTGRLAERLLRNHLPMQATYRGVDQSSTMVELARGRLSSFGERAQVDLTDGSIHLGDAASSTHVVSTYVLDLLSDDDIAGFLAEAHRVLAPGGRVCLAGLAWGPTMASGLVSRAWNLVWKLRPVWVGGCRPMDLLPYLSARDWEVEFSKVVVARQLASQIVVGRRGPGS